jgi:hypothetical protein
MEREREMGNIVKIIIFRLHYRRVSTFFNRLYCYWILMGKPEGRGPLGRPRSRWVENIKMDLREL